MYKVVISSRIKNLHSSNYEEELSINFTKLKDAEEYFKNNYIYHPNIRWEYLKNLYEIGNTKLGNIWERKIDMEYYTNKSYLRKEKIRKILEEDDR